MDNKLKVLKSQKTKLLNRNPKTLEEFEIIQNKLTEIETKINIIKTNRI